MFTISAKGRTKDDGTLDLHVTTALPAVDVDVLLILDPVTSRNEGTETGAGAWPEGYFERTFGSLQDNPIAPEPPPAFEPRQELR